ncbi:MAG: lytic transglycosylase domain-containing protein [Pseudothermotoga sp.]
MQKLLIVLFVSIACFIVADPLFFFIDPKTHVSIELYNNLFKLSILQPFVYSSVQIDSLLSPDKRETMKGLMSVESNFFLHAFSKTGAMGLTQLMPSTARELGVLNPFNLFWSIDGAQRYLARLENRFGNLEYALAAYYEGPSKVASRGPSLEGLRYANKVLFESKRLKDQNVCIKDVLYIKPYIGVGETFSIGTDLSFSMLGILDVEAGVGFAKSFSQFVYMRPNISDSLGLIIGEKDLNLTVGVSYRKLPDFGVQFLLSSNDFDLSVMLKVWQIYFTAGISPEGLRFGVVK